MQWFLDRHNEIRPIAVSNIHVDYATLHWLHLPCSHVAVCTSIAEIRVRGRLTLPNHPGGEELLERPQGPARTQKKKRMCMTLFRHG